jgi:hypothetical protein
LAHFFMVLSCRKSAVLVCFGKYSGTFHTT